MVALALPGIGKTFSRGEGRGRERSQKYSTYSAPSKTPTLESENSNYFTILVIFSYRL